MIPQLVFNKVLKAASLFIGSDKPGLHVVHFNFLGPDGYEIAATDGHRLFVAEIHDSHTCPPGTRISLPPPMVEDLLRMFPPVEDTEVTLAIWDGSLLITNSADTHMVKGSDPTTYPPYRKIMDDLRPAAGDPFINPKLLATILKDVGPLIPRKNGAVRIQSYGGSSPIVLSFEIDDRYPSIASLEALLMSLDPVVL